MPHWWGVNHNRITWNGGMPWTSREEKPEESREAVARAVDESVPEGAFVENVVNGLHTTAEQVAERVMLEEQTNKNEDVILGKKSHSPDMDVSILRRLASRFPRSYYFTTQLIVPLLILIGMAFLFGWALASLQSPGEIEANDAQLSAAFEQYLIHTIQYLTIHQTITYAPRHCLEEYSNATNDQLFENSAFLYENITECAEGLANETFPIQEFLEFLATQPLELTFDWIDCKRFKEEQFAFDTVVIELEPTESDKVTQSRQYLMDYISDFGRVIEKNGTDFGYLAGLEEATGSGTCKPHVAGGALFWFTIMTTIGYGNTAPTTTGARLLVFTCGFVTIIGFLALNGTASNILMTIIDDLLIRLRLRKLTKGIPAVILWLCLLILWMLVLALCALLFFKNRVGEDQPLANAYWFSYVTITTVGFGDIYLPHSEFVATDMFFIPLVILFGFVILGNFASKLLDLMITWFPADQTLASVLEANRKESPADKLLYSSPTQIERRHSF